MALTADQLTALDNAVAQADAAAAAAGTPLLSDADPYIVFSHAARL